MKDIFKLKKEYVFAIGGVAIGFVTGFTGKEPIMQLMSKLREKLKRRERVAIPEEHLDHIPPEADDETVKKVVELFDYEKENKDIEQNYYKTVLEKEEYSLPEFDEEEPDEVPDELEYPDDIPDEPDDSPYQITSEEYGMEEGYDQTEAHFYDRDEVFTDERDERMDDWTDIVGKDAADQFVMNPNINNFFVRNERLKKDIEIIRVKGGFDET